MKIALEDIVISENRKRALREVSVINLVESIRELGLLNPITITRADNVLVAGLHRVEAARRLGWTHINCNAVELNALQAELAEIDENLMRNEPTAIERAEWLARRKEIHEALHPETKAGTAGGKASGASRRGEQRTSDTVSFVQDAAAKLGTSPRSIERDVQIATSIPEGLRDRIRNTPLADRKRDLLEIARAEPEEQEALADELLERAEAPRERHQQDQSAERRLALLVERIDHAMASSGGREALALIAAARNCATAEATELDAAERNYAMRRHALIDLSSRSEKKNRR